MDTTLPAQLPATVLAAAMFLAMLVCLEIGRRIGNRRIARGQSASGFGALEGAIFGLFGLLVAFTFSGAASRFDAKRMLIADEANAIGTAYMRLDLLAPGDQAAVRQMFRDYLDSRLEVYRRLPNVQAALEELQRTGGIQQRIWAAGISGLRHPEAHPDAPMLLVPALNSMFDIASTRTMAARTHPPFAIFSMLFVVGWGCALLAGHAMATHQVWSWLHAVIFAAFIALATFLTLDLEYPRGGLIEIAPYDKALHELRDVMK